MSEEIGPKKSKKWQVFIIYAFIFIAFSGFMLTLTGGFLALHQYRKISHHSASL